MVERTAAGAADLLARTEKARREEEARTRPERTAQAVDFLRLLWGPAPPAGFLVTWSKNLGPRSRSAAHADLADAASSAIRWTDLPTGPGIPDDDERLGNEVYFGTCLQAKRPEWGSRGKADGACAMPGLWADLDVAGPAHKSDNLPPTKEDAAELARRAPWPPTLLVDSGNGLQAWWLFPEPWILDTAEARKDASDLCARLQACLRDNPEGWDIDSTADLARVLRLPGAWNRKLQHREDSLRRRLADAESTARHRAENQPPPPQGTKWDDPPDEWKAQGVAAAELAEEVRRDLAHLEAAGTAPALVRVLSVDNENRRTPEEWHEALPPLPRRSPAPAPARPTNGKASSSGRPSAEERAARYLRTLGPAVEGSGGDAHTTRAAWAVAVEFGLPEAAARRVLQEWDRGNLPPWQDTEPEGLEAKLRSALMKASGHPDFERLAKEDRSPSGGSKVVPIRPAGRQEDAPPTVGALALQDDPEGEGRKPTQAERLLSLAASADLFRTPTGEAHVTLEARGRQETWPVRGKMFATWLRQAFLDDEGRPVGAEAVRQAVDTLEAKALQGRRVRPVYIRSAGDGEALWIDLDDEHGRAVRIGPEGWTVAAASPVAFRRTPTMTPLPVPSRSGSWEPLRELLPIVAEDDWILFCAWLIGALAPSGPYPVLMAEGTQGAGKSSLAKAAISLLHPVKRGLQSPPPEERDLWIRAGNTRLLTIDNLRYLPDWLVDALCRIYTGGSYSCRELRTDTDEITIEAQLPVILTAIEGLAQGDDLADRAIVLNVPLMPDSKRIDEETWDANMAAARPAILGALYDALSGALAFRNRVSRPEKTTRLARFIMWNLAAEASGAVPWAPGRFMEALQANRGAAATVGLERNLLASTLAAFVEERREWRGTATDLLAALSERLDQDARRSKSWPKAAHVLSGKLPKIAPLLREHGILVSDTRTSDKARTRLLTLRLAPLQDPSAAQERERGTL